MNDDKRLKQRAADKRHYAKNPNRRFGARNHYGPTVTREWFEQKKKEGCEICGCKDWKTRQAQIDHDHTCCAKSRGCPKCMRGVLCNACNLWLSVLENTAWCKKALAYLKKYEHPRS